VTSNPASAIFNNIRSHCSQASTQRMPGECQMRKEFLIASIMALGMGIAQAQSPRPMQGGPDTGRQGAAQTQSSTPGGGMNGATAAQTVQNNAPQTFSGCLTRSSSGWSLASDQGKTMNVSGADNQLSQYSNQQVNIQGVQSDDGSISVSSIDKVADSCSNSAQSTSTSTQPEANQSSTTSQSTTQSTTTTQPSAQPPSSTGAAASENNEVSNSQTATPPATQSVPPAAGTAATEQNQNQSSTGTTNPPPGTPAVTSQTPPNNVGSGSTAASSNSTASNPDQNAATSSNPPSSTEQANPSATTSNNDQNAGVNQSGAASNQNAGQGTAASSDQNAANNSTTDQNGVRHITDMPQNGQKAGNLPQTASPLPLLALLGVGSFGAGLLTRRKK
jgi:hypothetical protein